MQSYVSWLSFEDSRALIHLLTAVLRSGFDDNVPLGVIDSNTEMIEAEFLGLNLQNKPTEPGVAEVFQDLFTGSAADDVEGIRASLVGCLDAELLRQDDQKSLLPLSKALRDLGFLLEEDQSREINAAKFYTPRMRPRDPYRRLVAFWEANVLITSMSGALSNKSFVWMSHSASSCSVSHGVIN